MAYANVTKSFGIQNANSQVTVTNSATGAPAIMLSGSTTGGILNNNGIVSTDASGNISIYVDTAITWSYTLADEQHQDSSVMASNRKPVSLAELNSLTPSVLGTTYLVDNGSAVASPPYYWDGLQMVQFASIAPVVPISGATVITAVNAANYNGRTLEFTAAATVTLNVGLPAGFHFTAIPPASGNASIASDLTTLLNGATTTLTRTFAANTTFLVRQRWVAASAGQPPATSNSFLVTGV